MPTTMDRLQRCGLLPSVFLISAGVISHVVGNDDVMSSLQAQPDPSSTTSGQPSDSRVLNLSHSFIADCLRHYERHSFRAESGEVFFHPNTSFTRPRHAQFCRINLTAPARTVWRIDFLQMAVPCCSARFRVQDNSSKVGHMSQTGCGSYRDYVSHGRVLSLLFKLLNFWEDVVIRFRFTSQVDDKPKLEVVYDAVHRGYIQSPLFDGQTVRTSVKMDSWVNLCVPDQHTVMLSFPHVDVEALWMLGCDMFEILRVYSFTKHEDRKTLLWEVCNAQEPPPPSLLKTDAIFIQFVSETRTSLTTGFRVSFSFHNQSRTPLQSSDGAWNCSVSYAPEFVHHLECNLLSECLAMEDEWECVYSSPGCGPGVIAVAGRCYIYVTAAETVTWYDASFQCLQRHGYLASLNTQQEWHDVIGVLNRRPNAMIYLGLQSAHSTAPHIYHNTFVWVDQTMVYYRHVFNISIKPFGSVRPFRAAVLPETWEKKSLMTVECDVRFTRHFLCEFDLPEAGPPTLNPIPLPEPANNFSRAGYTTCPAGHVTHSFLSCDRQTSCWLVGVMSDRCEFPVRPLPPAFGCRQGVERVPYTVVCDFRPDCGDLSDEEFCVFTACQPLVHFDCGNRQCVPRSAQCDEVQHCVNAVDEMDCYQYRDSLVLHPTPPPAVVHFTGDGNFTLRPQGSSNVNAVSSATQPPSLDSVLSASGNMVSTPDVSAELSDSSSENASCPESHLACPFSGRLETVYYCLPLYIRCNGVFDCPGREDEEGCADYSCPGLYRCRNSRVCLHPSHVCDGISQCLQQDDELLCGLVCPQNCTCYGLAFYCHSVFPAGRFSQLRFLDASGSRTTPEHLVNNRMLVHLNLMHCQLENVTSLNFPNLCILDLSYNQIQRFHHHHVRLLRNLQDLSLAANPLQFVLADSSEVLSLSVPSVLKLDLSHIRLEELDTKLLTVFPGLTCLNLSATGLKSVDSTSLKPVSQLHVLDVRGCPLTSFPHDLFQGLHVLHTVYADNYKLCCPTVLPADFNARNCHAPFDEISSCEDLLRSHFYRVVLAVFASLTLLGNLASFGYRTFLEPASTHHSYGVFVHHLSVSDFCMGVYLALIGVADRTYQGSYVWKDEAWRRSVPCRVAGFTSLLSSEVSVCLVCLITVDRLLVLHCPFTAVRFTRTTAHVTCGLLWTAGLVMAALPLLPVLSHGKLYGHNAICVPLPLSQNHTPGHLYSFAIVVVFNFVMFVVIAVGQSAIFWSVRHNSLSASQCSKPNKELTVARRLITVAMTDFLCWFPIGSLALLASAGYVIPGEVNVALAMLVLPLNSAINPFLYTLNILLEKRQRAREKRLFAAVTAQLKATRTAD